MQKLEQTNSILKNIFDPRKKTFNVFVQPGEKQVKKEFPLEVKVRYIEYYLEKHWQEIVGENLVKNCAVSKLQGNTLLIKTKSSLFANELFMMKKLLLQKINKALDGRMRVVDLKFHTGKIDLNYSNEEVIKDVEPVLSIIKCPVCGAKMLSDNKLCNVCERNERKKLHESIVELLKIQPWLNFKDCQQYIKCDRIAFLDAKEALENFYFEKVRLGYAEEIDNCMAVMLLTGKNALEIDEKTFNNSLEFLRRKQDVLTSRI